MKQQEGQSQIEKQFKISYQARRKPEFLPINKVWYISSQFNLIQFMNIRNSAMTNGSLLFSYDETKNTHQ